MPRNDIKRIQQAQSTQSARQVDKDNLFMTENYGGLNVESNPLNMPLTDTPSCMNVEFLTSGAVRKRKGSQVVLEKSTIYYIVPFKVVDGSTLMLVVQEDNLILYYVPEEKGSDLIEIESMTLSLFSDFDTSVPINYSDGFDHVIINDDDHLLRIILFSNRTRPVQISVFHRVGEIVTGAFSNFDYRFQSFLVGSDTGTVTGNMYLIKDEGANGIVHDVQATSVNCSVNETYSSSVSGEGLFVSCAYQYWCPSLGLLQDQVYQQSYKLNGNNFITDNVVEVPVDIQTNLIQDSAFWDYSSEWHVPVIVTFGIEMNEDFTGNPWTSYQYAVPDQTPMNNTNGHIACWFTNSQFYKAGLYYFTTPIGMYTTYDTFIESGSQWLQFGALAWYNSISAPVEPFAIGFLRCHFIPFSSFVPFIGTTGVPDTKLQVISANGTVFSMNTSGYGTGNRTDFYTDPTYFLMKSDSDVLTSTSSNADFIRFDASYPLGINDQSVFIFLSADATVPETIIEDGNYVPVNGLAEYFLFTDDDFNDSKYASLATIFQNRLVIGDIATTPSSLLFSNVGTESRMGVTHPFNYIPALKYTDFSVTWSDINVDTDPFEVKLGLSQDERITNLVTWYDDLFVSTNRSIYRVHGGQNVGVSPTNHYVSKVANVGAVKKSMTLTSEGVFFLNSSGVYQIKIESNTGNYYVENVGIKVREIIKHSLEGTKDVGYMFYNEHKNALFVGLPHKDSETDISVFENDADGTEEHFPRRLLVYYIDRESWSEWCTFSGYFPAYKGASLDDRYWFTFRDYSSFDETTEYSASNVCEMEIGYADYRVEVDLDTSTGVWGNVATPAWVQIDRSEQFTSTKNPVLLRLTDYENSITRGKAFRSMVTNEPTVQYLGLEFTGGTGVESKGSNWWIREPMDILVDNGSWTDLDITLYDDDGKINGINIWNESKTRYETQVSTEGSTTKYTMDEQDSDGDGTGTYYVNIESDSGDSYKAVVYLTTVGDTASLDADTTYLSFNYPTWWTSPAYYRRDISKYKRMLNWYGMFSENDPTNTLQWDSDSSDGEVYWNKRDSFNVQFIQNGTKTGQVYTSFSGADSDTDVDVNAPQWNDWYRIGQSVKGNFDTFQFRIYSFNPYDWEMVGYQMDTDTLGSSKRRAYNE